MLANPLFDAALTQLHTVRDCLRFAVSRFNEAELFFGHGSDNAYDEAVYLILHALHLPHESPFAGVSQKIYCANAIASASEPVPSFPENNKA